MIPSDRPRPTTFVERLRRLLVGPAVYDHVVGSAMANATPAVGAEPFHTPCPGETASSVSDDNLKLALAHRAYEEVLDATKHQDDKIGRFLTAIAFLTTGAVTLTFAGSSATDLARRFSIHGDNGGYLLAWSAGAFFFFVIGSVILLLLCLSVPVRRPSTKRSLDPNDGGFADDLSGSRIFYSYIGLEPATQWRGRWDDSGIHVQREMIDQFVKETHNLAERAKSKYRHTVEAASLFVLALLFLAVALALKVLVVLHDQGPSSTTTVNLGRTQLLLFAAIAAAYASLQLYTRFVHDKVSVQRAINFDRVKSAEARAKAIAQGKPAIVDPYQGLTQDQIWRLKDDSRRHRQSRAVWMLLLAVPSYSFMLASAETTWSPWARALMAVAATVFVWIAMWATRDRGPEPGQPTKAAEGPPKRDPIPRWVTPMNRRFTALRAGAHRGFKCLKVLCVPAVAFAGLFTIGAVHLLAVMSPAVALAGMSIAHQFVTDGASLWRARNFTRGTS